ncbi:MAG: GNAT family N-acetyltransferase, partial [Bullifex sp.]|nr:GNAT family N-acetyltransferase [Spirochaetales bacterium]MDY5776935.1 GNAT family N-acetyltransferase [Bullifex sp.]
GLIGFGGSPRASINLALAARSFAFIKHRGYVIPEDVRPSHQGRKIASRMLSIVKDKYKDYLYIEVMLEDRTKVPFYEKNGFKVMEDGKGMLIRNLEIK